MNYDELATFMEGFPHIPRYELKCHPSVVTRLRELSPASAVTTTGFCSLSPDLLGCPVITDDTMFEGEWVIRMDGEILESGVLVRPADGG